MRQVKKSDVLECLEPFGNRPHDALDLNIFDRAGIVHVIDPHKVNIYVLIVNNDTFHDYANLLSVPNITNQLAEKLINVVFDI